MNRRPRNRHVMLIVCECRRSIGADPLTSCRVLAAFPALYGKLDHPVAPLRTVSAHLGRHEAGAWQHAQDQQADAGRRHRDLRERLGREPTWLDLADLVDLDGQEGTGHDEVDRDLVSLQCDKCHRWVTVSEARCEQAAATLGLVGIVEQHLETPPRRRRPYGHDTAREYPRLSGLAHPSNRRVPAAWLTPKVVVR